MSRWRLEVRSDISVFDEIADWWNAQSAVAEHPLLHTNILRTWENGAFEAGSRLRVHLLMRDGCPVAGLPLYRVGLRHRNVGRGFSNAFDIVHEPVPEVIQRLPSFVESVPFVDLGAVESGSPLVAAAGDQRRWSITQTWSSPRIDLTGGPDAVLSRLSAGVHRHLRRARRRLEELGRVGFAVRPLDGPDDPVLRRGLEMEAAGWKGRAGTAVLSDPTRAAWHRRFVAEAAAMGWLHTAVLTIADRAVAFEEVLSVDGVLWGLVTSFDEDPDVARGSPGRVLQQEVLRWAAGAGLRRYDLGYGSDPWKDDWKTDAVPLVDIRVFGRGALGRSLHGADLLRSRLRRP